jgi:lysophospholipase L1-like esterase
MSEYNNPRQLPNASASDPCTIVDNAISFDKVINSDSTVTTYTGKQILSLSQAIDKFGFGVAPFTFTTGGTLESKNLLVSNDPVDSFLYKYVGPGSFPLTVTAGTNPTVGSDWQPFAATSAEYISQDGGGSVQDFIDDTESTLTKEGILSPFKNCSQLGKLLADGTLISIGCTGDSTMYGYDANTGLQNAWNPPASLSLALNSLFSISITPINYAESGSTLRQMISGTGNYTVPFSTAVNSGVLSGCDLIYCNHGINDSQLNNSIDQYREDIIEFVRLCRVNNKVPVLVTPNPNIPYATGYGTSLIDDAKTKRLGLFVDVMREIAKRLNVDLVDQYYYFTKSFDQVNPLSILPDGVHMSDIGYRQAGFNLAIPLITANTLYKTGDSAGFQGTTYKDNATVGRNFKTDGTQRTGVTFTCNNADPAVQGINFPVIMDVPTKVLSLIGLQWQSAGKCDVLVNSSFLTQILYQQKNYGSTSALNWDAENKIRHQFLAGLNVISLLHKVPNTGLGVGMAFAGVYTPSLCWSDVYPREGYAAKPAQIGLYDSVFVDDVLFTDDGLNIFKLIDFSGANVLTIDKQLVGSDSILRAKLWRDGSVVSQTDMSVFSIPDGNYPIQISLSPTSVDVLVSGTSASIALTEPLPSCYVGTPWKHFLVKPSIQI